MKQVNVTLSYMPPIQLFMGRENNNRSGIFPAAAMLFLGAAGDGSDEYRGAG